MILFSANDSFAEKKLFDDFSSTYLNRDKWWPREYVSEVVGGEYISKLGNSAGMPAEVAPGIFRNNLQFANPNSINSIECEITIEETKLDSAPSSSSFARIGGYFYNKNETGGATGDIFAHIMIGDQGNGKLEAFWEVQEMLTDDTRTWNVIGSGTISEFDTSTVDPPYKVKISYDGDNTISFLVNEIHTGSYIGPIRKRAAVTYWKGISTGINATNGSNNGFVFAKFDNVKINNQSTIFEDFANSPLKLDKWGLTFSGTEFAREISNGHLRANVHSVDGTYSSSAVLSEKDTPYLEAKVRISSESQLSAGSRGFARIQGIYYNESRGPGSGNPHNEEEGNVFANVRLDYQEDGSLVASTFIVRSNNSDWSDYTMLLDEEFSMPIYFDTDYILSIKYTKLQFIMKCNNETKIYNITSPTYPPFGEIRVLQTRNMSDSGQSGYMKAQFDDVYIASKFTGTCPGDDDGDKDVDGEDLAAYILDDGGLGLDELASNFGKENCL